MTGREQQVILIQRHDPDEIVMSNPSKGTKTTRLEDLRSQGPGAVFARSEIALVNRYEPCKECGCDTKYRQYAVYATKDGGIVGDGIKYLNDTQLKSCLLEAMELVAIAKVHPEFEVYLRGEGL